MKPSVVSANSVVADIKQSPTNSNKRITASAVCALCGGISDMTLWRWLDNSEMNFPRPIYIGRRRYWREVEIYDWLNKQPAEIESARGHGDPP